MFRIQNYSFTDIKMHFLIFNIQRTIIIFLISQNFWGILQLKIIRLIQDMKRRKRIENIAQTAGFSGILNYRFINHGFVITILNRSGANSIFLISSLLFTVVLVWHFSTPFLQSSMGRDP